MILILIQTRIIFSVYANPLHLWNSNVWAIKGKQKKIRLPRYVSVMKWVKHTLGLVKVLENHSI